ncbi:Ionotropic receptor 41a5 [Blattella germanica]|nr:Ionotropic receptor 41a5 [Blattella germanica]
MLKAPVLFLFLILILKVAKSKLNLDEDIVTRSIGEFVHKIVSRDFNDSYCIGIITEDNPSLINYIPPHIYKYHFHLGKNSPMPELEDSPTYDYRILSNATIMLETLVLKSWNYGCQLYIMQVSQPRAVIRCMIRLSRRAMFRANRHHLYLPVIKNGEIFPVDESIFSLKEMDCLSDLTVARIVQNKTVIYRNVTNYEGSQYFKTKAENVTNEENVLNRKECNVTLLEDKNYSYGDFVLEIRTHKYVGTNRSENILLDVWVPGNGTCSGGFLYSGIVFPDKTRNFEGKTLIVTTWIYPPFVIMNFNRKPPLLDGIEFRILYEYLKFVNATYRVTTDPLHFWGENYPNGTGNGVTGVVGMDKADIGFSAYYSWPKGFQAVDFADTHMRSSVVLVTARPKLKPGYLVPLMPFDGVMWGAVAGSLVGCIYALYGLQKFCDIVLGRPEDRLSPYSNLDYSALRSIAMLLNQGPVFAWDSSIPRHVPARHFVGWFQFMGEVISDTYNAGLASVLSSPRYEKPIETIHDLATKNVIWAANHISWIWSIEEDESPELQKITRNFRLLSEEEMIAAGKKNGEMGFVLEKMQGGHFTTESHINEDTVLQRRVMKGTLYWSHLYFLLRKGSPLMRHFNILVGRVRESGLAYYWEADVIRNHLSNRLQLQIAKSRILYDDTGPRRLNLSQLQGAFFLLALGEIVGLVAFLLEHSWSRAKKPPIKVVSRKK